MELLYKIFSTPNIELIYPALAVSATALFILGLILLLKKLKIVAVALFIAGVSDIAIALLGYFVASDLSQYALLPFSSDDAKIIFYISPGDSLAKTAKRLSELKIITHPEKFVAYARRLQKTEIKKGEYELSRNITPDQILDMFYNGKVKTYKITVPEGCHYRQIASLFAEQNLIDEKEFLALAGDKNFLKSIGINSPSAEGYLFPDTYLITRDYTAKKLLKEMVKRFNENYTEEIDKRAKQLGLTKEEVVTLASIIEKETGAPEERALISGVFHNRLKKKMKLQTDPTVIYAEILDTGGFDGNITKSDLLREHPYNTYTRFGLPPGAIASPGKAALTAAVNPEKTDALYFVSKNDGTHIFCPTYECHEKYVNIYQRGGEK